jgi:HK97 family phage portal protein
MSSDLIQWAAAELQRRLEVRAKAVPQPLAPVSSWAHGTGWWPVIREPFSGAWQRNLEVSAQDVLTFAVVWACVTLIARDISKLWLNLVERDENDISLPTERAAFSPFLRKPNHFQHTIQFIEHWMYSKLTRGNTYALKMHDGRDVVTRAYVLDPSRVKVLVAPDTSVFYQLSTDNLAGIDESAVTVPASEIIHDRWNTLYHPLVGLSPIYACGLPAMQALKIQSNSEQFFANLSQPGGVLTAPNFIPQETADRIKAHWESNFTGINAGRIAVLGDGLHYEPLAFTAQEAELVKQLQISGEHIAMCFGVPLWKVNLAPMPPYGNVQAANIEYYATALQHHIESLETCLDHGLGIGLEGATKNLGVEFDLAALLRMDSGTQMDILTKGVAGAVLKPNEARAEFNKKPVEGGDNVLSQQQNFALAALAERDRNKPFAKPDPATPATPAITDGGVTSNEKAFDDVKASALLRVKAVSAGLAA